MRLNSLILLPLLFVGGREGVLAKPLPEDGRQQRLSSILSENDHHHPTTASTGLHDSGGSGGGGVSVPLFASLERMARLVDIAYCVGTTGTGISPPFSCLSRCKDFPSLRLVRTWNTGILMSDSSGYIAVDHGQEQQQREVDEGPAIIVAFRGTYSITNTIVDLSTIPQEYVPYPAPGDGDDGGGEHKCENCTVHMGFLASWRTAREVVLPALKAARAKHPGYPVHLVGHSLGGAVAALAALELRLSLGWKEAKVTTFGEPRVGNEGLVKYIDAAFGLEGDDDKAATAAENHENKEELVYRRVTHTNDPVPLLPLTEWGFRSHAGEVYITKADLTPAPGDLRLCVGDDDPECSGGAEVASGGLLGDWSRDGLSRAAGVKSEVDGDIAEGQVEGEEEEHNTAPRRVMVRGFPTRLKLWQLLFAHRDYFWRLGLCVPGGDPADWGRERYNVSSMTPSSFTSWDGDGEL
ncbi:Alpha/Beta hydrolase protein [Apodospora peruviana]|uniref:Alpha/Beta hydrolase protein n=1 Tax=Apodospora peruviana TaxID=516989 RepID=A0AAE0IQU6_9PEZI|nr:Alpha/Beta hydrolase protein [Apodospora peruviana]